MIGRIKGSVIAHTAGSLIIDVGGVGYKVHAARAALTGAKDGKEITLWTHLAVKDDSLDLYGFVNEEELSFFQLLIGVSGIGPKSALGIINLAPVEELEAAIASGDASYLTRVSGIGKKTAGKIVLELKDKFGTMGSKRSGGHLKEDLDALTALESLGYSQNEAREALREVDKEVLGTQNKIKAALKLLARS